MARNNGGFRPGSGRKRREVEPDSPTFSPDEIAWISAVVAASPIASTEIKRGCAELMVTAMRLGRYTAKLEAVNKAAQDDAKAFSACLRGFLKAVEVLKLADPPPLKNPFDPPEAPKPEAKPEPTDALLKEIAG